MANKVPVEFRTEIRFERQDDGEVAQIAINHYGPDKTHTKYLETLSKITVEFRSGESWLDPERPPRSRVSYPATVEGSVRAAHKFHKLTNINVSWLVMNTVISPLDRFTEPDRVEELPLLEMLQLLMQNTDILTRSQH